MSHNATGWPRQYARQILAMHSKEERRAALAEVPEHLRDLTRAHVEIAWNHPKGNTNGQQTD
ncbi:hypothetical protein [Stutzerimonas nitrititolerans]|uniref:hypothetical protein n=1 Tax=Stutzerimonas nitrititolerans TaxID=2482751 RepID=UPI0028AF698B|nr:hypothetical protein [Stutzerimonas nitrititolerans]